MKNGAWLATFANIAAPLPEQTKKIWQERLKT
jgi:hypothetical protein